MDIKKAINELQELKEVVEKMKMKIGMSTVHTGKVENNEEEKKGIETSESSKENEEIENLKCKLIEKQKEMEELKLKKEYSEEQIKVLKEELLELRSKSVRNDKEAADEQEYILPPLRAMISDALELENWASCIQFLKIKINRDSPIFHQLEIVEKEHKNFVLSAVKFGFSDLINILLLNGLSADCIINGDRGRLSILFHAVKYGHLSLVELLLSKIVEKGSTRHVFTQALFNLVVEYCHTDILMLLFEKYSKYLKSIDVDKLLFYSVKFNNPDIVEFLLSNGGNINYKEDGISVLHNAASSGHLCVVKILVDKGADTKAKDRFRGTPLHYAANNSHQAVVQFLKETRGLHKSE